MWSTGKRQHKQQLGVALVSMLCVSTLCHNTMRQKAQKQQQQQKSCGKNKCFLHVSSATVKVKRQLDKKVKTI